MRNRTYYRKRHNFHVSLQCFAINPVCSQTQNLIAYKPKSQACEISERFIANVSVCGVCVDNSGGALLLTVILFIISLLYY